MLCLVIEILILDIENKSQCQLPVWSCVPIVDKFMENHIKNIVFITLNFVFRFQKFHGYKYYVQ